MNRNVLYLTVALLVVAVSALGYYFYYQENKTATGVDISVGEQGISIQKQ